MSKLFVTWNFVLKRQTGQSYFECSRGGMKPIHLKVLLLIVLILGLVQAGKKEDCLEKKCSDAAQRQKPKCLTFCKQFPARCKNDKPEPSSPLDCTEFTSEEECVQKRCKDKAAGEETTSCQKSCTDYWNTCGVD